MVSSRRRIFLLLALAATAVLRAQTPALTQSIPAQTIAVNGAPVTIDLRNYFAVPSVTGQVVQFDTALGKFNVELLANDAPLSVQNFLSYVANPTYTNSFVHRIAALDGANGNRIVQGGGYVAPDGSTLARKSPVALEYKLPNARGTLALARTSDLNSATSEWFFNVDDNTTVLGQSNGGGYAVFGRVLGTGMSVVDAMTAVTIYNAGGAFTNLPLRDLTAAQIAGTAALQLSNFVLINSITVAPTYPTATNLTSVIQFNVANLTSAVATGALSGSTLTITPVGAGSGTISIRAGDVNGNFIPANISVTVSAAASSAPAITAQPIAQTVLPGGTVAFSVTATGVPTPNYQWTRSSGQPGAGTSALIPGATSPTLVLNGTTGDNAALAGTYSVVVSNSAGTVTSAPATLAISSAGTAARLTNLSVVTSIASRADSFSLGYVVSGASASNVKPLVIRAAGPSLGALGFPGTLDDPKLELFAGSTKTGENEDWGGSAATTAAMAAVGAFGYVSPTSRDAAVATSVTSADNSVKITTGANSLTGAGAVIAEVYDATPGTSFTGTTPKLINFSVIKSIAAGGSLTLGFTIGPPGGTIAKTVLIRVIGPGLAAVGVTSGTLGDPQLTLFNSSSAAIASNDDWGANPAIAAAAARVNAFSVGTNATKDSMLLITLPPGGYTAQATGNANTSGLAIVEVYEVP
jgi:cyclophilin family peptidyl-prolyl cis-trans isomerase